jgi:hypothetical protein
MSKAGDLANIMRDRAQGDLRVAQASGDQAAIDAADARLESWHRSTVYGETTTDGGQRRKCTLTPVFPRF